MRANLLDICHDIFVRKNDALGIPLCTGGKQHNTGFLVGCCSFEKKRENGTQTTGKFVLERQFLANVFQVDDFKTF